MIIVSIHMIVLSIFFDEGTVMQALNIRMSADWYIYIYCVCDHQDLGHRTHHIVSLFVCHTEEELKRDKKRRDRERTRSVFHKLVCTAVSDNQWHR